MSRPVSADDLSQSERRFLAAMNDLPFGRFEFLRIGNGEPVLDPWPTTVRRVKFGAESSAMSGTPTDAFELKLQFIEFFEYVQKVLMARCRALPGFNADRGSLNPSSNAWPPLD
jgi:hypothetical protein